MLENDSVSLSLTRVGGMMAPVTFTLPDGRRIAPYYVSPWQEENLEIDEPVLVPLRGDFFCAPFGAGSTFEGVDYVSHGPAATGIWGEASETPGVSETPGAGGRPRAVELRTSMEAHDPLGSITKSLTLREGHTAV